MTDAGNQAPQAAAPSNTRRPDTKKSRPRRGIRRRGLRAAAAAEASYLLSLRGR